MFNHFYFSYRVSEKLSMEHEKRKLAVVFIQIVIVEKVGENQNDENQKHNRHDLVCVELESFFLADIFLRQLHQKSSVDCFVVLFTQTLNFLLINNQFILLTKA